MTMYIGSAVDAYLAMDVIPAPSPRSEYVTNNNAKPNAISSPVSQRRNVPTIIARTAKRKNNGFANERLNTARPRGGQFDQYKGDPWLYVARIGSRVANRQRHSHVEFGMLREFQWS